MRQDLAASLKLLFMLRQFTINIFQTRSAQKSGTFVTDFNKRGVENATTSEDKLHICAKRVDQPPKSNSAIGTYKFPRFFSPSW